MQSPLCHPYLQGEDARRAGRADLQLPAHASHVAHRSLIEPGRQSAAIKQLYCTDTLLFDHRDRRRNHYAAHRPGQRCSCDRARRTRVRAHGGDTHCPVRPHPGPAQEQQTEVSPRPAASTEPGARPALNTARTERNAISKTRASHPAYRSRQARGSATPSWLPVLLVSSQEPDDLGLPRVVVTNQDVPVRTHLSINELIQRYSPVRDVRFGQASPLLQELEILGSLGYQGHGYAVDGYRRGGNVDITVINATAGIGSHRARSSLQR